MRTIRASEIGAYHYCRKAWWFHLQGIPSENVTELEAGVSYHQAHGRRVVKAALARGLAWFVFLLALVSLAVGLTLLAVQ